MYQTEGIRLICNRSNLSPKFNLMIDDSIIIDEKIFLTSIVIWNKGKLTINQNDIRKDIIISCYEDSKFLDVNIINETHPEISNFLLEKIDKNYRLDWDYFDPGFGVEIQVIYCGSEINPITVTGYVLGSKIKIIKSSNRSKFVLFGFLVSTILVVATVTHKVRWEIKRKNKNTDDYFEMGMNIMIGLGNIFIIFVIIRLLMVARIPL